ncbi:MAG: zinc ribbon domain-containing protein [Eubacteriales bacterium]|nr:zinc ribbon domain-containing protein [Eubacteriales bacterium]
METKDVLVEIRGKHNLTQEQMAEKLYVTRQAVSRWETGETIPNTETLKRISREFGVSINTLLGSPQKLICQCCGMPLEDENISRETDGAFNEEYCKWCYAEGKFVYSSLEELMDFLGKHMSSDQWPEEAVRAFLQQTLPTLRHWRQD